MLEVVVGGAISGLGAFIFGYLLLTVFRWLSPDGFLTKILEDQLNTQAWEKPTETNPSPVAEPTFQRSETETAAYQESPTLSFLRMSVEHDQQAEETVQVTTMSEAAFDSGASNDELLSDDDLSSRLKK